MSEALNHYKQGLGLFGQGKFEEAIASFQQALASRPQWAEALHALATAQSKAGDQDSALATIEKVIALDPEDPLGYTSQSIFLQRKGLIPEADKAQAKARMASWKQ